MLYQKIFFLIIVLNLNAIQLFGQDRLKLEKADILEGKIINGEKIQFLTGNIIITKGALTISSDQGRNYERAKIAYLYENVTAKKENTILTCDTITFYSNENKILSIGDPRIVDENFELIADSILVFTEKDSGVAFGNVYLKQKGQNIYADRIEYIRKPNKDGSSFIAIGNVSIKDSSRVATCGRAKYDRNDESTILQKEPEIRDNRQTLTGNKIFLKYEDELLETLFIPKKAYGTIPNQGFRKVQQDTIDYLDSLEYFDEMEGSTLRSYFTDGKIDSMKLEGMASTIYHVFEDSLYEGRNETSGDEILISFKDSEIDKMNINGGSQGSYTPDEKQLDNDSKIIYSAEKIYYNVPDEKTDLSGQAKITHEGTNLEAGFVSIDWKTNILNALPNKSEKINSKTNLPVIREKGKDPMTGDQIIYNTKTKKGKMLKGSTRADDGYYTGNEIRNESNKVIFIQNSTYTTCDLETPHFHFESTKMKIIQNDIVIARPIILHLAQIPIFGIPLGIFPHRGGRRHSGWIMPSYGESKHRGQYLDGLGFYWAPNEYWDSKLSMSLGDKQGVVLRLDNKYRLRYKFSGSLFVRSQQFLTESNDILDLPNNRKSDLNIRWAHTQILRNNQSFNANVTYSSSGDYNKKYGLSEADRMNQKAISNISYSKRWPKSKNSISANLYSNRDLLIKDKTNPNSNFYINPTKAGTQLNILNRTLPKISFRHGQSNLIPTSATSKRWYNNITWNYGLNFTERIREYYESEQIILNDSTNSFQWIMDQNGDPVTKVDKNQGWVHTSSINSPQKLFKHISVNPSFSIRSNWVNKSFESYWNDSTNSVTKISKQGFATRTTGSFYLSANTKLYGMFSIPMGPLKVVRHTVSPALSFSYRPDFSKPVFGKDLGYTKTYLDSTGNEVVFDRFAGTMAGSTPRSESKSLNFSLNNIFQGKIDEGDKEKKVDLFSWRMSSGYNFAADQFQLANLRSSVRSKIAGKLALDISMTHDFYKFQEEKGRVSELIKDSNGLLRPRLTNIRFSTGLRFSGNRWADKFVENNHIDNDSTSADDDLSGPGLVSPTKNLKNTLGGNQLWSTNVSLSLSYTSTNPSDLKKTFWVNTNSSFQVTKNWKVSYRARFNMIDQDLVNHSFSIYRDLHCWELSLNWTPSGYGQGVNLRINVKSPTLRDLKFEKRGGAYSRSPF